MKMANPVPQYSHFVATLKSKHPTLAYLHVIEPRIDGTIEAVVQSGEHESNDFIRAIWKPRPLISAGGYTRQGALKRAEKGELIAFGRFYISNVRFFNLYPRIHADLCPILIARSSCSFESEYSTDTV
jgi:NADPH2 dehydrogenase